MIRDAATIRPDAPLAEVAAVMFEGRFSSLPVMDEGGLVGIITERDVLLALAQTVRLDPDTCFW